MKSEGWSEHAVNLGDFELESGQRLAVAKIKYCQIGALNAPKDNLILLPTYYGGRISGVVPWVDHPLSPLVTSDYCIVIPALLGSGESSSPSNTAAPWDGPRFPSITIADNVRAQHALIENHFSGAKIKLVAGWSMGGLQSIHWAALYPDQVGAALAVCATAKCYPHNRVFLEGVASALRADPNYAAGDYHRAPTEGLIAFARNYLAWAYSQRFFRLELYRELGFSSMEALQIFWEQDHLEQDANDLLHVLTTWKTANVFNHLLPRQKLMPRTLFMPSSSDLYFTAEDVALDAEALGAECVVIESDFCHIAGGPGRLTAESQLIFQHMARLLQT